MKIAITAGGTGGHIYPGIAIAEELIRRDPQNKVLFIGSEEGLENDLVRKAGYAIKLIRSRALLRKLSYKALSAPFISTIGFFQAAAILRSFAPKVLISTGGYASLPVVLAARLLRIPIFVHEQNVLPGVTNRICFKMAAKIFLSFDRSLDYVKGMVVGNPVRREIILADRALARRKLGLSEKDKMILIMGGSQGARSLNQSVVTTLPGLSGQGIKIMHIVGRRDNQLMERLIDPGKYRFYKKVDYLYNIAETMAAADLVVSRAGATAIAEFLVRNLPMVLVPFPFAAERHQEFNADAVVAAGAAIKLADNDLTAEKMTAVLSLKNIDLEQLSSNCSKLARPRAAEEIVNAIL